MQGTRITPGSVLGTWVVIVMMAILFSFVLAAVLALPVMWLWNSCITDLFNLKRIGYVRAFEIILLARLLFAPTIRTKNVSE